MYDLIVSSQLRAEMMLNAHFVFSTLAESFEQPVINNPELIKGVIHFDR